MSFHAGPLTYLTLLYVESTSNLNVHTLNSDQTTKKWTLDLLRARQDAELAHGGFGYTPLIVDERDATETTNSQRSAPNVEEAKEKRKQVTNQQNPLDEPMVTPLVVSKSVHVCNVATPLEGTNKSTTYKFRSSTRYEFALRSSTEDGNMAKLGSI
ncbi:hypothetical protein L6452_32406 [Arctium lappa]|uniref:Uncharacterized protein n=1 Tax=Arctium lappa TaxID=4217 RepID=A0ACB8Z4V9_ARCLA|nr:hypothetical protein L6452_32406 [Arctium lappa]